jgi:hypothetical protein
MRVELPSGGWVELRTKLKARDLFAVRQAVQLDTDEDGIRKVSVGIMDQMRNALLTRVILAWSFDERIPSENPDPEALHELEVDDYNALERAVSPLMDKVGFGQATGTTSA